MSKRPLTYVHMARLDSAQANAVHVMRMCDAFVDAGRKVTLIALKGSEASLEEIKRRFGCRNEFDIRLVSTRFGLLATLLQVVFMAATSTLFRRSSLVYTRSAIAAVCLAALPVRVVVEQHAPPSLLRPRLRKVFLWLLSTGRYSLLVVISASLREIVASQLEAGGVTGVRILVAHDGADSMSNWRPEPLGRLTVGYAGHLYEGRGIELVVEVARRCADVDFVIAGGSDADLARWRGAGGLPENIQFLGRLEPRQVPEFLLSCNVLLAPYAKKVFTENQGLETSEWMSPLKIFEYMSSGRAIICSRLPVLQEVLSHGQTALLCDPGDVEAWTAAVQKLKEDPSLRNGIGLAAKEALHDGLTWSARARSVLEAAEQ